jgi:endonuclease G
MLAQQFPQKIDTNNQIIVHDGYVLSYNEGCEQANWVYYTIKPSDLLEGDTAERKDYFKTDKLVETGSANYKDYTRSGYDRGHLKPAADEPMDQEQMNETFYMSNITPQYPSFKRGIWKSLESFVREQALMHDSVTVITGGMLDDSLKTIGDNDVCIPTNYFKVLYLYSNGRRRVKGFLIPNTSSKLSLEAYLTPIDIIEEKTKLKFFD